MILIPATIEGKVLDLQEVSFVKNGVTEKKIKASFYVGKDLVINVNAPVDTDLKKDEIYKLSGNLCSYVDKTGQVKVSMTIK